MTVDLPAEGIAFELIERAVIERALEMTGGNVTQAARFLRMSRDTLRYRIERLNIDKERPYPSRSRAAASRPKGEPA